MIVIYEYFSNTKNFHFFWQFIFFGYTLFYLFFLFLFMTLVDKEPVFLLGGKDAEMQQIKKRLSENWISFLDKNLSWWANIQDYRKEIIQILKQGKHPIAIELTWAGEKGYKKVGVIDHHWELAGKNQASLLQVLDYIGVKPDLEDELISANDSGYIPEVIRTLEKHGINDPKEQWKHIEYIRSLDRKAQGIGPEQEKQAIKAIAKKEILIDWKLVLVYLPHSKTAAVTDRLHATYSNLLIISDDGEINFFGNGLICEALHKKFWGWAGNINYGKDTNETAYWWGYPNHQEVKSFIIDYLSERE